MSVSRVYSLFNHAKDIVCTSVAQDSARIQYQLPGLTASLSPPTSPVRRPSPYTVLLAHEREVLRSRRVKLPTFKARPLNPKVFTSAGDLGVPRIAKKPLTVPVSPVFSTMRKRSRTEGDRRSGQDLASKAKSATIRTRNGTRDRIHHPDYGLTQLRSQLEQQPQGSQSVPVSGQKVKGVLTGDVVNATMTRSAADILTTPTWKPLIVRPLDAQRPTTQLCTISGPPYRQDVLSSAPNSATTKGSVVTKEIGHDVISLEKGGRVGQTKLRRPSTRPVPFRFATTELERKRTAAAAFSIAPIASSDMLTLEDLA